MARTAKNEKALTPEERLAQALVPDVEQPYRVPENWCWCKAGIISIFERGITFPASAKESYPSESNIPCLRTANVQDELALDDLIYVNKSYMKGNSSKLSQVNDIIMSSANSRELVGKTSCVSFLPRPMTFGGFVLTIRTGQILSKYLFFFLRFEFLTGKFISESSQTTNIANISTTALSSYPIPLAPLAEQQRIVDRIESLFAKLDEAKEKAQAVVDGFEDRKAAILHKAFTGELTAEWRKDSNAADWECVKLGTYLKPMETRRPVGDRFSYIDIDSIDNKKQEVRAPKDTLVKDAPSRASRAVHHGDVLFSMVRPYLKNIALIDESLQECIASTGFYVCTPKSGLASKYLYYLLCSKDAIDYLMQFMKGDNSPSIRKDDLLNMQIMLPSNQEQIQIVRILDNVLEHEQQAKEAAEQVIDQIDAMKKSILARAFRGELGTNDPTDESAVELLKRTLLN